MFYHVVLPLSHLVLPVSSLGLLTSTLHLDYLLLHPLCAWKSHLYPLPSYWLHSFLLNQSQQYNFIPWTNIPRFSLAGPRTGRGKEDSGLGTELRYAKRCTEKDQYYFHTMYLETNVNLKNYTAVIALRWRQDSQEFMINLSYIVTKRPAWVMWVCLKPTKQANKQSMMHKTPAFWVKPEAGTCLTAWLALL